MPPETMVVRREHTGLDQSSKYFAIRRSTRLPLEVPVRVTSTDPKNPFEENCTTVTVSAHGCGVISPRQLASGTPIRLEIVADKQSTNARILEVVPLNDEETSWLLGMELEHPGNFWGIKYAPADWAEEEPERVSAPVAVPAAEAAAPPPPPSARVSPPESAPETEPREPEVPLTTGAVRLHIHRPAPASKSAAIATGKATSTQPGTQADATPAAPAKTAPAGKIAAASPKEIPVAVLRRLLSECRLAAISVGACYVQTGTTFPLHAPVKLTVHAGGEQHTFHGSVRVEHVGAGMGIEFSGSGDEHASRIAALIDALSNNGDKIPEVRIELAAPDKNNPPKSKTAAAAAAERDSLLGLVLVGGSLKRSDFLQELEKQRRNG